VLPVVVVRVIIGGLWLMSPMVLKCIGGDGVVEVYGVNVRVCWVSVRVELGWVEVERGVVRVW